MNVCLHICICTTLMPSAYGGLERVVIRSPGTGITGSCELPYGCLELQMVISHVCTGNATSGPLQLLLTAVLSLHPLKASFKVVVLLTLL